MPPRAAAPLPLVLLACTASSAQTAPRPTPPPPAPACEGAVATPPEGARPADDPGLLAQALGAEGAGKLCAGAVFEATRPLTVYRVWQRDRAHSALGRWWSFDRPEGPRDRYRAANVVCPAWSALDALTRCELRAGARFVLGPGQSARCDDGAVLPRSPVNQVYVDQDARRGVMLVENCHDLGAWP